jgi:hypothetical protein
VPLQHPAEGNPFARLGGRDGRHYIRYRAYQAVTGVGDWRKKGMHMVAIGLGAAVAGFQAVRLLSDAVA